jgi:hypothetical protein
MVKADSWRSKSSSEFSNNRGVVKWNVIFCKEQSEFFHLSAANYLAMLEDNSW